jgi:hypothetical protein
VALIPTLSGDVVRTEETEGYYRWAVYLSGCQASYPHRTLPGEQVVRIPRREANALPDGLEPGARVVMWAFAIERENEWEAEAVKVYPHAKKGVAETPPAV